VSGGDGHDVEAGLPRLSRGLRADGDHGHTRTGGRESPRGGAGHEQREVGVRRVRPQLDRPVERQEVGVEDVSPRAFRGSEQQRALR
jgi:hypothetical protein